MQFLILTLIPLCGLISAISLPSVPPPSNIDINDPSAADPKTPPTTISFPTQAAKPETINNQPDQCDGLSPSDDCFRAMNSGGYLWFDKDSQCSNKQKSSLMTAVWDAFTLALWSSNFPNVDGARGPAAGTFYMGPDFPQFNDRISGNLKRAANFKTPTTSEKTYITTSCKDTKNYCSRRMNGKGVGGYGWTYSGWFGYYHYITLCPSFFTLSTLREKLQEVEGDLSKVFLHEMMHTRLVYGDQPEIIDEWVDPIPKGQTHGLKDYKAYGADMVRLLAKREIKNGGGATRASTNADSYAILANALWWWDVTGYFPGVPGKSDSVQAESDGGPVTLHVNLGNVTDVRNMDLTNMFDLELSGYGNGTPDLEGNPQTTAPLPSANSQKCHGISGNTFVLNSGIAEQNAKAFCSQSTMSMQYGGGTINDMQLSITAPPGTNKAVADSPDCVSKFTNGLIHGCDGDDPKKNPYNSKYGGNITTSNRWIFSFEPRANQGVANNCNTQYKFSVDTFDIRGNNFDPIKLGNNGEGLKKQIEGCSKPIVHWE